MLDHRSSTFNNEWTILIWKFLNLELPKVSRIRHDNDTIDILDYNHWCDLCSQRFIKNRSMVAYAQINLDCKDENDVSYANVANFTKPLNSSRLSTASKPRSFWVQLNWWYSDVIGDRLQFISVRVTFIFKKKSRPNRFDNHYLDHLTT